jgi:hypothetical protein
MLISESGRIVLIDDKRKEIEPVLISLGKHGIPFLYFNGTQKTLPDKPLEGIRFVFLDIELRGMKGQSGKTKASGVVAVLKKIISKENGPYVIVFWTLHKEDIDTVLENCNTEKIPPVAWVDLEKPTGIEKITGRLEQKLGELGAFQLYVEWENIVNKASKEFVRTFSLLVNLGNNWSKDTAALFYKLYKSYVEDNELPDKEDRFKCACHLMNRSFLDTLEYITRKELKLPKGFELKYRTVSSETIAKLNSSLFLGEALTNRHNPGNVYTQDNEVFKRMLISSIFKEEQSPGECTLCKVIISPECDIAHNKMISITGTEEKPEVAHRILYGLLAPVGPADRLNQKGKEGYFQIPSIWHDSKEKELIFHFATMSFSPENEFTEPPLFTLKRDLLFDLQSKAANHVNRLGNYLLK